MDDRLLEGRIGIVTGATSGIGEAIAGDIVANGGWCVINGRREGVLGEKADLMNALVDADVCNTVAGDCADEAVIERLFETAVQHWGEPNLVVVNAGRGLSGSVLTSDPAQWEELFRTNVIGASRLMRRAAERMIAAGPDPTTDPSWQGKPRDIVVIGSTVGRHVSPFSSLYGGSKFAVHGIVEGLRREVAKHGIRVTLIEPGIVRSEFQGVAGYDQQSFGQMMEKISPVLTPEDIARTVTFVVSQPAAVHVGDVLIRPTRQEYP